MVTDLEHLRKLLDETDSKLAAAVLELEKVSRQRDALQDRLAMLVSYLQRALKLVQDGNGQ